MKLFISAVFTPLQCYLIFLKSYKYADLVLK